MALRLHRVLQVASGLGQVGQAFTVSIPDAHLWSPADPYLYNVTVSLISTPEPAAASLRAVNVYADNPAVSLADAHFTHKTLFDKGT